MTSENRSANITSTLKMLQEEVVKEIDLAKRAVTNALSTEDHGTAERLVQRSKVLTAFRDKVAGLRKEWRELAVSVDPDEEERVRNTFPDRGRLPPGQRTPETEFVKPILQVLQKMGGSAEADVVVERVGRIMKPVLQEVDYEPLGSDGNPRWHKTTHWTRYRMVKEGFLNPYSRRGIWEISEKGRLHLGS